MNHLKARVKLILYKCMKSFEMVEKLIMRCEGIKPSELGKVINEINTISTTRNRLNKRWTPYIKMNQLKRGSSPD